MVFPLKIMTIERIPFITWNYVRKSSKLKFSIKCRIVEKMLASRNLLQMTDIYLNLIIRFFVSSLNKTRMAPSPKENIFTFFEKN